MSSQMMFPESSNINPYDFGPATASQFVGRWSEVNTIASDMALGNRSYACVGGRRCGKTSMLRMVEHTLNYDPRFAGRTVCLFEDPMGYTFVSPEHVFATLLRHLCDYVGQRPGHLSEQSIHPRIDLSDISVYHMTIDAAFNGDNPQITAEQFGSFVNAIFSKLEDAGGPRRMVILLDEMENFLHYKWQTDFYAQLRSVISSGAASFRLRVVLAGSKEFLTAPGYRDSPLMNVLTHVYLSSFDEEAVRDLCSQAPGVSDELQLAIWNQSGGHPFIATYLLTHLFDNGLDQSSRSDVDDFAQKFILDRTIDLESWSRTVGLNSLQIFGLFVNATGWLDRQSIIRHVADPKLNAAEALTTLSYHCLLLRNKNSTKFAMGGNVFREWYLSTLPRLLKELSPEPVALAAPDLPPFFLQLINHGPLAAALGSGSIAVGGNATDMIQVHGSDNTTQTAKDSRASQAATRSFAVPVESSAEKGESSMLFSHGYALLIGVDKNNVAAYNLPEVSKDIDALQRVLTHPDRCAYPPDHVKIIMGADATRDGILNGLTWLSQQLAEDTNATAVIHYSGHGWRDVEANPPDYYFIPYDMQEKQIRMRALRASDFANAVADIQPKRLLVLMDCCHAGGMGVRDVLPAHFRSEAVPDEIIKGNLAALGVGAGRAVISASTGDQVSYNRLDRTMGVFTYHLIEALTGHAQPKEGSTDVLVSDVISYLQRSVPATVKDERGSDQQPVVELSGTAFPVALLLGGRGLARGSTPPEPSSVVEATPGRVPGITGDDNVSVIGSGNVVQRATGGKIAQASGSGASATVNDHSRHTVFDQTGQTVGTQYNIAGDYNPRQAEDRTAAVDELNKLLSEVVRAGQAGVLDPEAVTDTEYQVKKAMQQAQKPDADKTTIIGHLNQAKEVIVGVAASVTAATGLATAISQAIQMVQKLF